MKITKYSTNCVKTQTDVVRFEVTIKAFWLDAVKENKHYIDIAELWSGSGARVYKSVFLGDTAEGILRNWSSDKWGKPDFRVVNALAKFWETLKEKGKENESKSS
jgi:hypothetical protein